MDKLHTGARWVFRLRAYYTLIVIGIFIAVWSYNLFQIFAKEHSSASLLSAAIFYIAFVIAVAEIYARMSYSRWLYEIGQEGIKIERGIIWKKYTSIPYERVQNVDIRRGILARIIGFSTVEIETAGQSGFGAYHGYGRRGYQSYRSEGHLPALGMNEAEKAREFIIKKVKRTNGAGL